MRVEILRARLYRGEHMDPGVIVEMDDYTADVFIRKGWARRAVDPAPLTTEKADVLIPTGAKRRRALR